MMAARLVGEEAFTKGVRAYVKKFAFQNTVTKDLFDCLGAASGKDVSGFVGQVKVLQSLVCV
jgi:aminopeptidase N